MTEVGEHIRKSYDLFVLITIVNNNWNPTNHLLKIAESLDITGNSGIISVTNLWPKRLTENSAKQTICTIWRRVATTSHYREYETN